MNVCKELKGSTIRYIQELLITLYAKCYRSLKYPYDYQLLKALLGSPLLTENPSISEVSSTCLAVVLFNLLT